MSFIAPVAALVDAVADVGWWQAAAEKAAVAAGARWFAPASRSIFRVGGVDHAVDPIDVAGHFGVDARPVGSSAAVAVARDAL